MNFDSLLYTDCRADEGLRGAAGFQFQAVSPGTADDVMNLVQRSALYEAPLAWMREKRTAASYPPSLVHLWDGAYITARGVYLGAEVGGTREGNQFTHAIATRDPALYDVVRPAQLWEAPWWCEQPAPRTECAPVPPEPAAGPCGAAEIQEWLRNTHDAQEWLICLLSAVEQVRDAGGKRVLFVGDSPGEVLKWIAAATLLLPQERALAVGFRVFTTNPHYCRHDIVAVHPDWSHQFARSTEFVVFDLAAGRHSQVKACASASYWVPRFLRHDPYDVVDAVELAHQMAVECGRSRPECADMAVSSILVLGESGPGRAGELVEWLTRAVGESAEDAAVPVTEAVLSTGASARELRELAGARLPEDLLGEVHFELLRAEIDDIVAGRGGGDSAAVVPAWSSDTHERARELVESAAARGVDPERVDELLRMATCFGITPRLDRFHETVQQFVRWWVDRPEGVGVDLSRWSCGAQVLDLLRGELTHRLTEDGGGRIARDIRRYWWELLLPTVADPFDPAEALVLSAAAEAGPRSRREAMAVALQREPVRRADGRAEAVWDAVFRHLAPEASDVTAFFGPLPRAEVTISLAEKALVVLVSSPVSGEVLDVLPILGEHMRSPHHDALLDLAKQDELLRGWIEEFSTSPLAARGESFPAVSPNVLRARVSRVIEVLARHDLEAASGAVASAGRTLQGVLTRALPSAWNTADMPDADRCVALAVLLHVCEDIDERALARLGARLDQWVRTHDAEDCPRVSRLLRATSPDAAAHLQDRIRAARGRGKSRNRWRPGRRREKE